MAPRTHHGSCHCGNVKYSANLDLEQGTVKCNCSICAKQRGWETLTKPSDFTLVEGEANLTKYTFNSNKYPHYFCKRCGTQMYLTGDIPGLGETVSVQVQTLDDVTPKELEQLKVKYIDNLNDTVRLGNAARCVKD